MDNQENIMDKKKKLIILISVCAALLIALTIILISCLGNKNNDDSNESEHVCYFSEWQTVTEPTCASVGERKRSCTCGEYKSEELDALGHAYAYTNGVFEIRDDVSLYRYYCTRPGCNKTQSMDATENVYVVDPTCSEYGHAKHTYYVIINGEYVEEVYENDIDPLNHSFNNAAGKWTWNGYGAATYTLSCTRCNAYTETYTATMSENVTNATCVANGVNVHTASVELAGATYTDSKNEILYKTAHVYDYDNGVWTWNGTRATYTVYCTYDLSHSDSVSANATVTSVAPDCENDGHEGYAATVSIGGKSYTGYSGTTTPALSHDYDLDNITWEVDGDEAYMVLVCLRDSNHVLKIDAEMSVTTTLAPTCENDGEGVRDLSATYNDNTYTFSENLILNALGHEIDIEKGVWTWDGTAGATFSAICTRGEAHTAEYSALSDKSYAAPDCINEGYELYTVTVLVNGIEIYDEKEITLDPLGHNYVITNVEWNYEGTVSAKISVTCQNDYRHENSGIEFAEATITTEPTCTRDGALVYTVEVEIESQKFSDSVTDIAEKLGHNFINGSCSRCNTPTYSEGLEFVLNSKKTGYILSSKGSFNGSILSIPSTYNGLPVVEIADSAFKENGVIAEIWLSENLTYVGADAFSHCASLKKISFADTDTSLNIGSYAFYYCKSLTELDIPSYVTNVKESAFGECSSLETIRVAAEQLYNSSFHGMSALRTLELKEGIKYIGNAFSGNFAIFSVTLPSTLTALGNNPFDTMRVIEVKNLSSVSIQPNLASAYNFYRYLKNVYTDTQGQSYLSYDGNLAFYNDGTNRYFMGCVDKVEYLYLPDYLDGYSYDIYYYAFSDIDFGEEPLYLPDGVRNIYGYAARWNDTLKVVFGGKNVEMIDAYAFQECGNLMSFTVGSKVNKIGSDAFSNCFKLYDVVNHSLLNIEKGKYGHGCIAVYAIDVTTDPTAEPAIFIDDGFAFYYRNNVAYLVGYYGEGDDAVEGQLTLPDGFNDEFYEIYKQALTGVEGIHKIKLSGAVTAIGYRAFSDSVDTVEIPALSALKRIDDEAFLHTTITSIFLPSELEYIGKNVFPESITQIDFADPDGWYIETIGSTKVDPEKLGDPTLAAQYFKGHKTYDFKKVENEE